MTTQPTTYRPRPTTPSPDDDYAAFIEWRYDLIAGICERLSDEEVLEHERED